MTDHLDQNPQREQMEHESMVRTLDAQTQAIWPQESKILSNRVTSHPKRILDIGCGTGLVALELAKKYVSSMVTGIDVLPKMVYSANEILGRSTFKDRVVFREADAMDLPFEKDSFDLILNRHVLQIIPDFNQVLKEMERVLKPGGRIHILAEDYGMIHFDLNDRNADQFWQNGPLNLGRSMGTEMQIGRKLFRYLKKHGFLNIQVDFVTVDPIRVDRAILVEIWEAWKDGYTEVLAKHSNFEIHEVAEYWNLMIETLKDPNKYAVWNIPVYSAEKPI